MAVTLRCGSRQACTIASMRLTTAAWTKVIYVSGDTWNVNPIALKRR